MQILVIVLIAAAIIYVAKGIIIVQQQEAVIVQRLGQYSKTLSPGLHWIVPFIESPRPMLRIQKQKSFDGTTYSVLNYSPRIDLRESVYDFPRQNVITKDNVTISINALLYYQN